MPSSGDERLGRYPRQMHPTPSPETGIRWIDTHCHLQLTGADPGTLLERAAAVSRLVVPGVDLESSLAAMRLADRHPDRLVATAGLHPHDASRWAAEGEAIAELAAAAAAVGETGLDFYRNLSSREEQIASFRAQHALAREVEKPLIVHCRDAFREVYDILESDGSGPWVVLHCWTGGPKWSRRFADLDVTFSFAGPVAFETGDTVRRGAAVLDPRRVMVETDTPYLSPPPFRHENNEPARVALVGAALASVWSMPVEQVAANTGARASEVFGL